MARVICIMGESGAGKTTSMRNLNPTSTLYIDCDKKGLSWKGWREQYSVDNRNYIKTDYPDKVLMALRKVQEEWKEKEVVVIDTLNGIMIADEMRRCKEKGYDKWQDLAQSVYGIVDYALEMREDVTIIFVAHTQTDREDSGYLFTHIKTSGKKLDKITLESKFTTVLLAKSIGEKHIFETQSNFSTAKSPMGAFEEKEIPNDIVTVIESLKEF